MKNSKLLIVIMALCIALCMSFTACQRGTRDDIKDSSSISQSQSPSQSDSQPDSSDPIEEITLFLSHSSLTMKSGETVTVTATVVGTDEEVSWSTDNDGVATVSDGVVTAVSEGSATITASVAEESASVTVTVADEKILFVETPSIALDATTMEVGGTTIGVTSKPIIASFKVNGEAIDAEISYTSSKKSVATVSSDGVVTAVAAGDAVIYVEYDYNGTLYEAEVKVTVEKLLVDSGVSYTFGGDKSKWEIDVTELGFTPEDVTEIYLANGNDFVQVDEMTGEILYNGNAAKVITDGIDIDSKTEPDIVNVCTSTLKMQIKVVYVTANNVEFVSEVSPMLIGSQKQLELYIFGVKADIDEVEWSVNKEHIATVDQNGVVTAVNYGTATITAKAYGYTYTTQQIVHKEAPVDMSIVNDNFSVHDYVGGGDRHGLLIATHGVYSAGDWVSFQFTPSADVNHGMLFVLYGLQASNSPAEALPNYPKGVSFATLGANSAKANLWNDSTFIVLNKDGRQVGSIKSGEGFGTLNANETYTVYVQLPDAGNPNLDVLAYFANNETDLDAGQAAQGVVAWRDYMGDLDVAVSFNADGYNGYAYNGETRAEIEKDDVFTLNVADLANNNRVDLSAWGIEEEILIARIEGISREVFLHDGGKPVFENGALILKSGLETLPGTDGEQTLIIETDNYRYLAKINLISEDPNMPGSILLVNGAADTELLNGANFNAAAASNTYAFINFYVPGEFPAETYLYVQIAARHVWVNNSYIYNHSLGWQADNGYCGDVIDVYRLSDGAHIIDQPENGGVLAGNTWYVMVIDLRARFWNESETVGYNDGLKMRGVGINAFVNDITFGNSKSITLSAANVNATVGDEITLTAQRPDFFQGDIVWASSDDTIATVVDGVVTTLKAGSVTITASLGGITASCAITVQAPVAETASVVLRVEGSIYDEIIVNTGSVIEEPSAPAFVSYVFDGWYNGDTKIDFANPIEANYILDARYVEKEGTTSGSDFTAKASQIIMNATDAWASIAAGDQYLVIDLTLSSSLGAYSAQGGDYLYMMVTGRHFVIDNYGMNIYSLRSGWYGAEEKAKIPADAMRIFDMKGNLVNDWIRTGSFGDVGEATAKGELLAGNTYRIVINLTCQGWTKEFLESLGDQYTPADEWANANGEITKIAAMGNAKATVVSHGAMTEAEALDIASPRANITFMVGNQVLESKEVVLGSAITAPEAPQMLSNTFNGWFLDGTLFDLSQGINSDTVLVASYSTEAGGATGNGNWLPYNTTETFMTGMETFNNAYVTGKNYYVFEATFYNLPESAHVMYFQISGAHFTIHTTGCYVASCEWDHNNLTHHADTFRIYNKDGVLVNDVLACPQSGAPAPTATNVITNGTYTIVLNLAAMRWTTENIASTFNMTPEAFFAEYGQDSVMASRDGNLISIKHIGAMSAAELNGISFSSSSASMMANDELTIDYSLSTLLSADDIVWASSDDTVATVENGVVKALKSGEATITATVGEYSAQIVITVIEDLTIIADSVIEISGDMNTWLPGTFDVGAAGSATNVFPAYIPGADYAGYDVIQMTITVKDGASFSRLHIYELSTTDNSVWVPDVAKATAIGKDYYSASTRDGGAYVAAGRSDMYIYDVTADVTYHEEGVEWTAGHTYVITYALPEGHSLGFFATSDHAENNSYGPIARWNYPDYCFDVLANISFDKVCAAKSVA